MKVINKKILAFLLVIVMSVACAVLFTGCIDSNFENLEVKLESEKNNYKANSEDATGIPGCLKRVKADYGDPDEPWYEYVVALFFSDEDSAITYYNDILLGYSIPAVQSEDYYGSLGKTIEAKRVYTIVLYGTEKGIATALE